MYLMSYADDIRALDKAALVEMPMVRLFTAGVPTGSAQSRQEAELLVLCLWLFQKHQTIPR